MTLCISLTEGARAALSLSGTMLGFYPVRVLPSKTAIVPVNPTFLPRVYIMLSVSFAECISYMLTLMPFYYSPKMNLKCAHEQCTVPTLTKR